jgi:hypothetical protein
MKPIFKNLLIISSLLISLSSFSLPEAGSPAPKPVVMKLTLQEVQIIQQVLQQIDLATQEVEPYLAICKPLEQLLDTTLTQGVDPAEKKVILRLPLEATNNLLLFMQRANVPALGAKQINKILRKIEQSLPKGTLPVPAATKKVNEINLHLTQAEARLTQQMLDQIEIAVSEVEPFLAIYLPLEQGNSHAKEMSQEHKEKEVVLKLPEIAPRNLLLFLERTRITGQQAKIVYGIVEKLQRLMASIAAAHNAANKDITTP